MTKELLEKLKSKEIGWDYNSHYYDYRESEKFVNNVIENANPEDLSFEYEGPNEELHESVLFIEGIKGRFYIEAENGDIHLSYEGWDEPID